MKRCLQLLFLLSRHCGVTCCQSSTTSSNQASALVAALIKKSGEVFPTALQDTEELGQQGARVVASKCGRASLEPWGVAG